MSGHKRKLSRRNFIKTAGAAGLGTALATLSAVAPAFGSDSAKAAEPLTVPTRPFGKTGVDVSMLALGGELSAADLLVFRQAFKMGVTYWDTADSYGWGKNEKAIGSKTDEALKMTENFINKGYTAEQAKLKVVWENPHIASICSAMPNMTILQANVAAALNKTQISGNDKNRLEQYARQTGPGYCAGCATICESAVDPDIPISDLMRCAMYHHGYGDREKALTLFNALPADTQTNIIKADYTKAEKYCPQRIQIGNVLQQTCEDLQRRA